MQFLNLMEQRNTFSKTLLRIMRQTSSHFQQNTAQVRLQLLQEHSPKMKLPMPAHQHGKEMVTVIVGNDSDSEEFSIHQSLACAASQYFRAALNSGFQGSTTNTVKLGHECPMAFAVLYHFLYTGQVSEDTTFYTQNRIPEDLHWLRTLKLADFTFVHSLLLVAYERLRQMFSVNSSRIPSTAFIDELYDDAPQEKLQQYIVGHTVYWIRNRSSDDWKEWKAVLERKADFGVGVAVHFAKYHSNVYLGYKQHPMQDHALYADEIYPEPKAQVKLEIEQGSGKEVNKSEEEL